MYRIVQNEKQWVVCVGPARLLAFDRKDVAVRTVDDAEKLMRARQTLAPALAPCIPVPMAEATPLRSNAGGGLPAAFVERRRTRRTGQRFDLDAAE
jgi:hypothetical protein